MNSRDIATLHKLASSSIRKRSQFGAPLLHRLERLASDGDDDAKLGLAWIYRVTRSKKRAAELYRSMLEGTKRSSALYGLATLELEASRHREGLRLLRQAARLGSSTAQFVLGRKYYYGNLVRRSSARAERHFRAAFRAGNAEAALWLGWLLDDTDDRWKGAASWYRKAAERGIVIAMFNLGVCLERGLGVRKDKREASLWYRRAARLGDMDAQRSLNRLRSATRRPSQG